jgi:ribosomal protein S18 acetylase RimI-like enzyme
MTAADVGPVAAAMARAFLDDPLQEWIFPDVDSRPEQLVRMFDLQIRHSSLPLGESYVDESLACAAFWSPPGHVPADDEAAMAMTPLVAIVGEAISRLRTAYRTMVDAHPKEPHFYLAGIGTEPRRQGQGLATAVLAPVLSRCDEESMPAYLESTKERNVGFYEHRGFRVRDTIAPSPGGPRLWRMWRDPR